MPRERLTILKKFILDYLKSVKTHPSAEKIYSQVKIKLPKISRATVYRILDTLKRKGEIQTIPGASFCFDADSSSHAHFVCSECGRIFDAFQACRECSIIKSRKAKVGKINKYQIYFYGICENCERK